MPPNFEWGFAGDVEMMQESAAAMGLAMILAIAFIYIVLASQFESFTEPLLIMLSLPLAVVGALLALLVTGNNIGMPAMIGVVMLMGLVTKNAILLVDLTNHYHRDEGLSIKDAHPQGRADPAAADPDDDLRDDPRHDAVGDRQRRGRRVPRADLDCHHRRADHLDGADAGRGAGGLPAAGAAARAAGGVAPASPARVRQATRIAGVLVLLVLAGWFWGSATVFGQTPPAAGRAPAPMTLTFDDALQRALSANESLKVVAENVRIGEARVAEAQAAFLPDADGQLPVPAVAEVPRDSDSGRRLRPRGADLRGGVRPPERRRRSRCRSRCTPAAG